MMMTSAKSYILVEPETLNIIKEIRHLRGKKGIPVCFTLDAGPNIHLLYPTSFEKQVKAWIEESLLNYCEDSKWIDDQLGNGPQQIYPAI
jgi:diphosphomevalonate decarboxylase